MMFRDKVFSFFILFYLYGNLDTACANADVTRFRFLPELVNTNNTCCLSPPDAEPPPRKLINWY